jgi:hypothetical protein
MNQLPACAPGDAAYHDVIGNPVFLDHGRIGWSE